MKIRTISMIAASLMLASSLHAGPQNLNVAPEAFAYRDAAKAILGIKRPIFIVNVPLHQHDLAHTENNASHSIISINKYRTDELMHTVYHEMGHIFHNHAREANALKTYAGNAYLTSIVISTYAILRRHHLPIPQKHKLLAVAAGSLASSIYAYLKIPTHTAEEKLAIHREQELQAEEIAFQLTKKTHGSAPLESKLSLLNAIAMREGNEYRRRGPKYPTAGEEIALIRKTLDTPDITHGDRS